MATQILGEYIVMSECPADVINIALMEIGAVALIWRYLNGPLWKLMSKPQSLTEVKAIMNDIKSALDKNISNPLGLILSLRNSVFRKRNVDEGSQDFGVLYHQKWQTLGEYEKNQTNDYITNVVKRILQKLESDWSTLLDEDTTGSLVFAKEDDGSLKEEEKLIWSNQQTERIFSSLRRQEDIENLSDGNLNQCTIAFNNNTHQWLGNLPQEEFEFHVKAALKKRDEYRLQNQMDLKKFQEAKTLHSENKIQEELEKQRKKEEKDKIEKQSKQSKRQK